MEKISLLLIRGLFSAAVALTLLLVMSGCATPTISYTPVFGHEFTPRVVPANVAQEDEGALIKGGYYRLGYISVDLPKNDPDRVREILRSEAAKHGGDVVFITDSGSYSYSGTKEKSGWVKFLEGAMSAPPGSPVYVYQTTTVTDRGRYAYSYQTQTQVGTSPSQSTGPRPPGEQETTTSTVEGFLAFASIWRLYDPQKAESEFTEHDWPAAAAAEQVLLVKLLLQRGAAVEAVDKTGYTALQNAAASGGIEVAKLLLDHGANVNGLGGTGYTAYRTPLMFAAQAGNVPIIKMLVSRGAMVDLADADHETALFIAARYGNASAVSALVALGAYNNPRNRAGVTLTDYVYDTRALSDDQKTEINGALSGRPTLVLRKATYGDLAALKDRQDLVELYLPSSQVTDAGLAQLKEMKGLKRLSLKGCQVTDAGLASLKEMKGLKDLDLSLTHVTDTGLAQLKEMKGLEILNLSGCEVTDAGLANLKEMKGLRLLFLPRNGVTDAGVRELRRALPNTRIDQI